MHALILAPAAVLCCAAPARLQALLRGDFGEEDTVVIEADDHGLVLRKGPRLSEAEQAEAYASVVGRK